MVSETLHPYQPTTTDHLPPAHLLDPSSLWTPTSRLELLIPPASRLTYAARVFRLGWVITLLPLHFALVLGHHLSPVPSLLPPPSWVPSVGCNWTLGQRLLYPIAGRLVWALTGIGLFPDFGDWLELEVPPLTRLLVWLISFPGRIRIETEVVGLSETARREGWVRGEAVDPVGVVGVVLPQRVAGFWVNGKADRAADRLRMWGCDVGRRRVQGGKVVMYLAGGGYVAGQSTEFGRSFAVAREAGVAFFHVNVRKASHPDRAFPGALLDAITGYAHLVELGYDEIILAGDSSGAAVATALALYLANTLAQADSPPPSLVLPVAVLACSPWCDLTLSTSTSPDTTAHINDILRPSMLATAAHQYLAHLSSLPPSVRAAQPPGSPARLLAAHPFLSPALPTSLPAFQRLARAYSPERPLRWVVCWGSQELFAPEVRALVFNLEQAAVSGAAAPGKGHAMQVEAVEFADEVHCCYLIFPEVVSPAAGRFWKMVNRLIAEA